MILRQSFYPILGSIFHPGYMMINAVVLGSILPDSRCSDALFAKESPGKCSSVDVNQAAFGIGSSTMSIILLAPINCYMLGLQNLIPQAYGANNLKLCGAFLNRKIVSATAIFTPFLIPL